MAHDRIIQHFRGVKSNLPVSGLQVGEIIITTDSYEIFWADSSTTTKPLVPDVASMTAIGVVASGDLIMMLDVSATGYKMRKITFDDFKIALNIPVGSSDEKVAVVSGGTSGYLWGTNGSDGVFRMGTGLGWTKDASNAFVTLGLSFASEAQGDLIYRNASSWTRLASGTAGQFLVSGGAGANPSWSSTIDCGTF